MHLSTGAGSTLQDVYFSGKETTLL